MIQIAIVEDEEIYVKQLTEYIRKYQTERGRSLKGTVFVNVEDITEIDSGGFDIILMDIQMPRMDEYAATKLIRAFADLRKKRIPVIAMTANAFADDIQQSMDAGMDMHLSKPIDIAVLEKTLSLFRTDKKNHGRAVFKRRVMVIEK